MTRPNAWARRGATLIELLVVLSIISALGALALMIAPGIANQDNTLKGTADVQSSLKIAQGMAAAAKLPRGVRLIAPAAGSATPNMVTELQYLESAPVLVPDPRVLSATDGFGNPRPNPPPFGVNWPYVEFQYELYTGGEPPIANSQWTLPGNPPANAIKRRTCNIIGLTADQELQVVDGSTLVVPTLGSFSRIIGTPTVTFANTTANPPTPRKLSVVLDVYPDAALGAGTAYRTYHFGLYSAPSPLLGEPTIPLPRNIGIDLTLCLPLQTAGGAPWGNYDVMFAPSGQMLASGTRLGGGQIFLWVRDYTKLATMPAVEGPALAAAFRQGGEQQIVSVRGAAVGAAPVTWPDMASGMYPAGPKQYKFARDKLTGQ